MQELIPEVEKRFRVIREPYARVLSGGSTGGWEALALQVYHPDFFGGAWSYCPDSVTFTDVEGINIYKDGNAYYKQFEWRREPTINSREINGQVRLTSQQRNYFELVNGTKGRSGEQIDIWSAVFGPVGGDGYFEPLFDKRTGVINPKVAEHWRDNYDLLEYLKRNWATVGPKLVDKLRIYTGDVDTYYLDNAVRDLEKWMKTTENPHYEGYFLYGDQKPHCWSGPGTQFDRLKEMAQHIMRMKPEGANTGWWRYWGWGSGREARGQGGESDGGRGCSLDVGRKARRIRPDAARVDRMDRAAGGAGRDGGGASGRRPAATAPCRVVGIVIDAQTRAGVAGASGHPARSVGSRVRA